MFWKLSCTLRPSIFITIVHPAPPHSPRPVMWQYTEMTMNPHSRNRLGCLRTWTTGAADFKVSKKNRYGPWWEFQCGYTHRLYSNHFKLAKKKFAFLYVTHIVLHTHLDRMIKSVSSISHERIVEISKFESFLNMNYSCWRKINTCFTSGYSS